MSLQGLISGSECAVPFNPLSQVLKHTEGDRSVQQVRCFSVAARARLRTTTGQSRWAVIVAGKYAKPPNILPHLIRITSYNISRAPRPLRVPSATSRSPVSSSKATPLPGPAAPSRSRRTFRTMSRLWKPPCALAWTSARRGTTSRATPWRRSRAARPARR